MLLVAFCEILMPISAFVMWRNAALMEMRAHRYKDVTLTHQNLSPHKGHFHENSYYSLVSVVFLKIFGTNWRSTEYLTIVKFSEIETSMKECCKCFLVLVLDTTAMGSWQKGCPIGLVKKALESIACPVF